MRQVSDSQTRFQITVRREVRVDGVGLHSGEAASVVIKPALPNTGILFIRTDLDTPVAIPARFEYVTQTKLATTLGYQKTEISTVEHLLSAFRLLDIDNAVVEVSGPEVPIMDGSSLAFCEAILSAGIHDQSVSKKIAVVKKRVEVRVGDKLAVIEPSHRMHIDAKIEWSHPAIEVQEFSYTLGKSDYREIARARTFGFLKEVEMMKSMGLARGGSLDNAIVLDDQKVLNPDGLRYPDEFIRHKVLDAIGDFALAPFALLGDVTLVKAGHEMHRALVSAIFADPNNYEVRSLEESAERIHSKADASGFSWLSLQTSY